LDALLVRLIFYAGTEWLGFRTLFSSCNLIYQVIKELHIVSLSKILANAKPKFSSHLSPCTRLRKENSFGKFVKKGDRVIVPVTQSDNTCPHCLSGHQNLCDNLLMPGFGYWGGLAEYAHIPNADGNLVLLPDSLDFTTSASMGCRFVTAYHGLINQVKVQAGEWIVVYGSGGLGLSVIQIANAIGAKVIAIDIGDKQLEMAKKLGAISTINSNNENPVEAVQEITKGGANVSVDALGITPTMQNAVLSLGKRGRHLQLGVPTKENKFTPFPVDDIFLKELRIIGSFTMPISGYPAMLNLVESTNIDLGQLITNRISLNDAFQVFGAMNEFSAVGMTVVDRF
jgi:D-arabinose 1-dehydrogenase-like Zn-dependent alcohol dehydrogenase